MEVERGAEPSKVFDLHYAKSSALFWRRFGGQPDLTGKRVLDFGCATGGMVHRVLKAGASSAVGIDLSKRAIDYAKPRLAEEWGDRADIRRGDIRIEQFDPVDVVVSQNTLEHVDPLVETLLAVVDKVKPGGELYFGFSPLWYSPYGHHRYPPGKMPWRHLIQGDEVVLESMEKLGGTRYASIAEAGFNKATPADFYAAFDALPVSVISMKTNLTEGGLKSLAMAGRAGAGGAAGAREVPDHGNLRPPSEDLGVRRGGYSLSLGRQGPRRPPAAARAG